MNKVEQAKILYGKIQGMIWNRDRNCEYEHYDSAKECSKIIHDLEKQIDSLNLTAEERSDAYSDADIRVAQEWYGRY